MGTKHKKCIFCNGITRNLYTIGMANALYLFDSYGILCDPYNDRICYNCLKDIDIKARNKIINNQIKYWDDKEYIKKECLALLLGSNIIKKGFNENYQFLGNLKLVISYVMDKELSLRQKKVANRVSKQLLGLKKNQIKLLYKKACQETFDKGKSLKKVYIKQISKEYILNKNDKERNIKSILIFLAKLRMEISNDKLAATLNINKKAVYIHYYHATALLMAFRKRYLYNTHEKIEKAPRYDILRKLMKVAPDQVIIAADGVRYRCQKSSVFGIQKKTFSTKQGWNCVNYIGMNLIDKGYYVGFYPESGTAADGYHWDGKVMDYMVLHNTDNINNFIKLNTEPYKNDGTCIVFDRALGNGCHLLHHGIVNYKYPCCKKQQNLTVLQGNRSRYESTLYRWINECSFGKLRNYWYYFQTTTHQKLIPIFGVWLNIAASIMNVFEIGMIKMSAQRGRELGLMYLKQDQEYWGPNELNPLTAVLKQYRYDYLLSDKDVDGTFTTYWHKCETIQDIVNKSPYWNIKKLKALFDINDEDIRIIGGGYFTFKSGWSYLIHSRTKVGIYISTFEAYKKLIMVRNIQRRLTKKGQKTWNDAPNITSNPTEHHVLIHERLPSDIIQNNYGYQYSIKVRQLFFACNCIAGAKTINADSHTIAALLYIRSIIYNQDIPQAFQTEAYWDIIIDVEQFTHKLDACEYNKRHQLLIKYVGKFNQE